MIKKPRIPNNNYSSGNNKEHNKIHRVQKTQKIQKMQGNNNQHTKNTPNAKIQNTKEYYQQ